MKEEYEKYLDLIINKESNLARVGRFFYENQGNKFFDEDAAKAIGVKKGVVLQNRNILAKRYGWTFSKSCMFGLRRKYGLESIDITQGTAYKKQVERELKFKKSIEKDDFVMTDLWRIALGLKITKKSRSVLYDSLVQ